ncbi:hypothetical protein DFH09DRAFT_1092246 [Mycena vulgaris]|nr:hypothetical protein DFH09DRAFT_1092246 [Mycena vulgaris]
MDDLASEIPDCVVAKDLWLSRTEIESARTLRRGLVRYLASLRPRDTLACSINSAGRIIHRETGVEDIRKGRGGRFIIQVLPSSLIHVWSTVLASESAMRSAENAECEYGGCERKKKTCQHRLLGEIEFYSSAFEMMMAGQSVVTAAYFECEGRRRRGRAPTATGSAGDGEGGKTTQEDAEDGEGPRREEKMDGKEKTDERQSTALTPGEGYMEDVTRDGERRSMREGDEGGKRAGVWRTERAQARGGVGGGGEHRRHRNTRGWRSQDEQEGEGAEEGGGGGEEEDGGSEEGGRSEVEVEVEVEVETHPRSPRSRSPHIAFKVDAGGVGLQKARSTANQRSSLRNNVPSHVTSHLRVAGRVTVENEEGGCLAGAGQD